MKKWKKPTKNFYMMPNNVFSLNLDPFEFMILSYMVRLHIESAERPNTG